MDSKHAMLFKFNCDQGLGIVKRALFVFIESLFFVVCDVNVMFSTVVIVTCNQNYLDLSKSNNRIVVSRVFNFFNNMF